MPLLDSFSVVVRRCRPLDPEGYEVTLELRRKPVPTTPCGPSRPDSPPFSEREEEPTHAS
jgi:hypothetical protein